MATRIVILGGGPAGYEAALVAAAREAQVTVIDSDGIGGAAVLFDCVPSKTFIASTGVRTELRRAPRLGFDIDVEDAKISLPEINQRVKTLANAQSADINSELISAGVQVVAGRGELIDASPGLATHCVRATAADGTTTTYDADVVLIATGASPRVLPSALPDGERILTWRQLYDLETLPDHLIVVGSGVTGAEFVNAYTELGVDVTVVASRDRVLPYEDADAALVLEDSFAERGVQLVKNARAESVTRTDSGVLVTMTDGRDGGGQPRADDDRVRAQYQRPGPGAGGHRAGTRQLPDRRPGVAHIGNRHLRRRGLHRPAAAGVGRRDAGPDRDVARAGGGASAPSGCARWPPRCSPGPRSPRSVFPQSAIDNGSVTARTIMLPLQTNARAKMSGLRQGFVKVFCRQSTGVVIGGVVVAPIASELILPIAMAVQNRITVNQLAETLSVYPSLSGSITEAARRLMAHDDLD